MVTFVVLQLSPEIPMVAHNRELSEYSKNMHRLTAGVDWCGIKQHVLKGKTILRVLRSRFNGLEGNKPGRKEWLYIKDYSSFYSFAVHLTSIQIKYNILLLSHSFTGTKALLNSLWVMVAWQEKAKRQICFNVTCERLQKPENYFGNGKDTDPQEDACQAMVKEEKYLDFTEPSSHVDNDFYCRPLQGSLVLWVWGTKHSLYPYLPTTVFSPKKTFRRAMSLCSAS